MRAIRFAIVGGVELQPDGDVALSNVKHEVRVPFFPTEYLARAFLELAEVERPDDLELLGGRQPFQVEHLAPDGATLAYTLLKPESIRAWPLPGDTIGVVGDLELHLAVPGKHWIAVRHPSAQDVLASRFLEVRLR